MKATIDIPDELYRRVKAKTALKGRAVRDVTIELFRKWIDEPETKTDALLEKNKKWLDEFLSLAIPADVPGPCAREILEHDRNRLEPKA